MQGEMRTQRVKCGTSARVKISQGENHVRKTKQRKNMNRVNARVCARVLFVLCFARDCHHAAARAAIVLVESYPLVAAFRIANMPTT